MLRCEDPRSARLPDCDRLLASSEDLMSGPARPSSSHPMFATAAPAPTGAGCAPRTELGQLSPGARCEGELEISDEEYKLVRILLRTLKRKQPALPWQSWMDGFLEHLAASHGHVSRAIELCEVSRDTVYRYRRRCEHFARRWDATIEAVQEEKRTSRRRGRAAERAAPADSPQRPPEGEWK